MRKFLPDAINICARYAYPPNSLSLCGPAGKNRELKYYSTNNHQDMGLYEILEAFSTLYPYLKLIASSNGIDNPFDNRVVEAYWIGNSMLNRVDHYSWKSMLLKDFSLGKKMVREKKEEILESVYTGGLPHHSFHVLDIYVRTNYSDSLHSIKTADACIINWGKVVKTGRKSITVRTKPLVYSSGQISFGDFVLREILPPDQMDQAFLKLTIGDIISYHWGYFCEKISFNQYLQLKKYTEISMNYANRNRIFYL